MSFTIGKLFSSSGEQIRIEGIQGPIVINDSNFSGQSLNIFNQKVFVDGKEVAVSPPIQITINGNVEKVNTMSGSVKVSGDVNRVDTMSGSIHVQGNATGKLQTMSGSINVRKTDAVGNDRKRSESINVSKPDEVKNDRKRSGSINVSKTDASGNDKKRRKQA